MKKGAKCSLSFCHVFGKYRKAKAPCIHKGLVLRCYESELNDEDYSSSFFFLETRATPPITATAAAAPAIGRTSPTPVFGEPLLEGFFLLLVVEVEDFPPLLP